MRRAMGTLAVCVGAWAALNTYRCYHMTTGDMCVRCIPHIVVGGVTLGETPVLATMSVVSLAILALGAFLLWK